MFPCWQLGKPRESRELLPLHEHAASPAYMRSALSVSCVAALHMQGASRACIDVCTTESLRRTTVVLVARPAQETNCQDYMGCRTQAWHTSLQQTAKATKEIALCMDSRQPACGTTARRTIAVAQLQASSRLRGQLHEASPSACSRGLSQRTWQANPLGSTVSARSEGQDIVK